MQWRNHGWHARTLATVAAVVWGINDTHVEDSAGATRVQDR